MSINNFEDFKDSLISFLDEKDDDLSIDYLYSREPSMFLESLAKNAVRQQKLPLLKSYFFSHNLFLANFINELYRLQLDKDIIEEFLQLQKDHPLKNILSSSLDQVIFNISFFSDFKDFLSLNDNQKIASTFNFFNYEDDMNDVQEWEGENEHFLFAWLSLDNHLLALSRLKSTDEKNSYHIDYLTVFSSLTGLGLGKKLKKEIYLNSKYNINENFEPHYTEIGEKSLSPKITSKALSDKIFELEAIFDQSYGKIIAELNDKNQITISLNTIDKKYRKLFFLSIKKALFSLSDQKISKEELEKIK